MLYNEALVRGQWGLLWAYLTGRPRALLSLEDVLRSSTVQAVISAKTRMVPIAQIDGSENRYADFDSKFNPLNDHNRDRWLNIARAWQRGINLPLVTLIQVGDHYFVRDGHHRISVARALGLDVVEATVEVWIVDKPLSKSLPLGKLGKELVNRKKLGHCGGRSPDPSTNRSINYLNKPVGPSLPDSSSVLLV